MSSIYNDYMRSVFGYEPINYRNTYEQEFNDYMEYANCSIPQQMNRNNETLEDCYPDIYKLVYPMVQKACMQNVKSISNELIDEITNEIYFALEDNNLNKSVENRDVNDRQIIGNPILRDLIKILILRELINRPIFRPRPPYLPRNPIRPSMRRPPVNRDLYEQEDNIYEY